MAVRADTRRWLIVAALFVVTYGVSVPLAAYGVFLPVLAEHFGWTRGAVSAALSLNLLVGGIAGSRSAPWPIGTARGCCWPPRWRWRAPASRWWPR